MSHFVWVIGLLFGRGGGRAKYFKKQIDLVCSLFAHQSLTPDAQLRESATVLMKSARTSVCTSSRVPTITLTHCFVCVKEMSGHVVHECPEEGQGVPLVPCSLLGQLNMDVIVHLRRHAWVAVSMTLHMSKM